MIKANNLEKSVFLSRLNKMLLLSLALVIIGHFLIVNDLSTRGFVFKDLKIKSDQLLADRQEMTNQLSILSSYQSVSPRIANLKLVTVDSAHYISWDKYMVARK